MAAMARLIRTKRMPPMYLQAGSVSSVSVESGCSAAWQDGSLAWLLRCSCDTDRMQFCACDMLRISFLIPVPHLPPFFFPRVCREMLLPGSADARLPCRRLRNNPLSTVRGQTHLAVIRPIIDKCHGSLYAAAIIQVVTASSSFLTRHSVQRHGRVAAAFLRNLRPPHRRIMVHLTVGRFK